jgi:hypothetical protein
MKCIHNGDTVSLRLPVCFISNTELNGNRYLEGNTGSYQASLIIMAGTGSSYSPLYMKITSKYIDFLKKGPTVQKVRA